MADKARDGDQAQADAPGRSVTHIASWEGPLPPPAALHAFEEIVPGSAAQIIEEFRAEAAHRRQLENRQASFVRWDTHIGQLLAIIFALAGFGVVGYAVYLGASWVAGILGAGLIGTGIVAFLKGRSGG